jgi:endonuclease YncB( thermonuclease family)
MGCRSSNNNMNKYNTDNIKNMDSDTNNYTYYYSNEILQELSNQNNDIEEFTLNNIILPAKMVSCYDGDTARFVINYNNTFVKYNCRLYKIDSPEIKLSKDVENREDKKRLAYNARNRLIQLCTDSTIVVHDDYSKKDIQNIIDMNTKIITLKCREFDKYGRLLIDIYNDDQGKCTDKNYINQQLINENYCYEYYGGTKQK